MSGSPLALPHLHTLAGEYAGMGMDSARSVEASATVDGSTTMLAVAARDASAAWEEAGLSVGAAVKAEQTARQAMSMTERIIMARSGAKVERKLIFPRAYIHTR